jgi:hypothetical protein
MTNTDLRNHKVVSSNEWLEARKHFLIQEKEFTRLRDQLSRTNRFLSLLVRGLFGGARRERLARPSAAARAPPPLAASLNPGLPGQLAEATRFSL